MKRIYVLTSFILTLCILTGFAKNTYAQQIVLEKNTHLLDSLKIRVSTEPNNQYLLKAIGDIYASNGLFEDALIYFDRSIKIDDLYFDAYYARGYTLNKLGKYKEAIDSYVFILNTSNDNKNSLINEQFFLNVGVSYQGLKELDKALKNYENSIKFNNRFQPAYYNKGIVLIELKKYDDAIRVFGKSLELDPNDASSYFNRAFAKYKLEDFTGAIADYNNSFYHNNSFTDSFKWIGLCYLGLGNINFACESWHKASKLGVDVNDLILEHCK